MTMYSDTSEDKFICGDCGYEQECLIDEIVGETVTKIVGSGRHKDEIETVICPQCGSENWHSESIRSIFK